MPERAPAGFTLVEVIVALTLLSVGVLAVAASGVAAARLITSAHRSEFVNSTALTLVDSLGAGGAIGSGRLETADVHLMWSSTLSPDSMLLSIVVRGRGANSADSVNITTARIVR